MNNENATTDQRWDVLKKGAVRLPAIYRNTSKMPGGMRRTATASLLAYWLPGKAHYTGWPRKPSWPRCEALQPG